MEDNYLSHKGFLGELKLGCKDQIYQVQKILLKGCRTEFQNFRRDSVIPACLSRRHSGQSAGEFQGGDWVSDCGPLWNSASPKDTLGDQEVHGINLASVMSRIGFTEYRASLETDFAEVNDLPMCWVVIGDLRVRAPMVPTVRHPTVCGPSPPYVRPLRPEGVSRAASLLGCPLAFRRLPVPSTPDLLW